MNYQEVKYFSSTQESREFDEVSPRKNAPFDMFKILRATIDLDAILSFREHSERKGVTVIEMVADCTFMVPMDYDRFKDFINKKSVNGR